MQFHGEALHDLNEPPGVQCEPNGRSRRNERGAVSSSAATASSACPSSVMRHSESLRSAIPAMWTNSTNQPQSLQAGFTHGMGGAAHEESASV